MKLTIHAVKHLPYAHQLWVAMCTYLSIYRTWVPGAGFKIKARYWRKAVMEMRDAPFKTVLESIVGLITAAFNRSSLFDPRRKLE